MTTARTAVTVDDAFSERVRTCVAEALLLDLNEVTLGANLIEELGADSLDFLDVVFRLEQEFEIQITRGEMERAARGDMSEEDFAPDGIISPAGLDRLRELMPEAADKIEPGLRTSGILRLFSVETFQKLVVGKLNGQSV